MPANVARRLTRHASQSPDRLAVIAQHARGFHRCTFRELDEASNRIARGLIAIGVTPGTRLVLLVPPGTEFVSLVFGLLKSGAVTVLIDPGMGREHLLRCLQEVEPEGFVAISPVQAVRTFMRRTFPKARFNVTVGRRWFWRGETLATLQQKGAPPRDVPPRDVPPREQPHDSPPSDLPTMQADDPAAIIFTSGSTGPPKGVLYRHGNFDYQVHELETHFGIQPGEIDLACFALFGLFNSALGVTTVFPQMNYSRPASADVMRLASVVRTCNVTQSFASPAIWNNLARRWKAERPAELEMPTLRRVFAAGAPVAAEILATVREFVHPGAELFTPYGATEALPVACIESREVLGETFSETRRGAGICVGRNFPGIDWQVIRVVDGPIANIDEAEPLPLGEIGELIVRGPVVTSGYVTRPEWNALSKICHSTTQTRSTRQNSESNQGSGSRQTSDDASPDAPQPLSSATSPNDNADIASISSCTFWHRMGDAGYFDDRGRFWYCGRVSHRVQTAAGTLYSIPCEAIFDAYLSDSLAEPRQNTTPVSTATQCRTALVGIGPAGWQRPVLCVENLPTNEAADLIRRLLDVARSHDATRAITTILAYPESFPVDVRHNAKINRELLAAWASQQLPGD